MCEMQAADRSVTLETRLHSVKVGKRSLLQGTGDVAMTELTKLHHCCDKRKQSLGENKGPRFES